MPNATISDGARRRAAIYWENSMTDQQDQPQKRETLREARLRRLLSITELWKLSHVTEKTIRQIESGVEPRLSTIGKLSEALGVDPRSIDWPGDPLEVRNKRGA